MKTFLLLFFCLYLLACTSSSNPDPTEDVMEKGRTSQEVTANSMGHNPITQEQNPIKFQYYRDKKSGLIQSRSPLPTDWLMHQETNAAYFITGPHGIKVSQTKTEQYAYANNQFALQSLQMAGHQIAPVYSLDQIIEQSIKPSAQAQGYSFIKSYPLPEVQAFWQRFSAGMPQTGSQRQYAVMGTEWKDQKGHFSLITIVQSIIQKDQTVIWSIQTTEMEAPENQFPHAKEVYLYGVAHTEINPQWQQYMNGKLMGQIRQNDAFWAEATRQSSQAHQQRMAAIQARGNTSQSISQTYSEISDISHAGYLKRSDINSAGHSNTINAIGERAIIGNQETGERYDVPSGSNYYWVNKNGEYISTDNSLYDPRIDNKINGSEWMKFDIEQ